MEGKKKKEIKKIKKGPNLPPAWDFLIVFFVVFDFFPLFSASDRGSSEVSTPERREPSLPLVWMGGLS